MAFPKLVCIPSSKVEVMLFNEPRVTAGLRSTAPLYTVSDSRRVSAHFYDVTVAISGFESFDSEHLCVAWNQYHSVHNYYLNEAIT
jgi:hypothetical protein